MKTIDDHRDFIIEAYVTEKKSTYEITQELGINKSTVSRHVKRGKQEGKINLRNN